ncbi:DUF4190 domain-containing protein [Microbacterium sp. SS28]|uniref:DUF4190 domain-containing protein n=1 Tax=Microbacterium sp. SS28 TaxID=2919948 RepID=UPI001FAA54C5|nr:DUF4190 domain-containing protein [Microbacterium sp. SS28]
MTTPPPDGTQPPAYTPPPEGAQPPAYTPPPAYGAPAAGSPYSSYAAAPPPAGQYAAPPTTSRPGRTLGIVAFVLSFFAQVIAIVLGIVALVQSRKAGEKNGFAVAAIIISSVLIVVGIILAIVIIAIIIPQAAQLTQEILRQCQELGPGIHEIGGVPVDCSDVLD